MVAGWGNWLYNVENSNGPGANTPEFVALTTTNSTLAQYFQIATPIIIGNGTGPVLVLQPNIVYTFSVMVIMLNSGKLKINTPVPVSLNIFPFQNSTPVYSNAIITLSPLSGTTPYNATLTIRIPAGSFGSFAIYSNITSSEGCEITVRAA